MLTQEQQMIVDMADDFAKTQMRPNAAEWEQQKCMDRETLEHLGSLGFGGIYVPETLGGSALSRMEATLIFEKLSAGCISTAAFLSIHNMATWMLAEFGSDSLRSRYLPDLVQCKKLISYCLTEPNAGSDAASLSTRAQLNGDEYVLNGSKAFISGAGFSDLYLVMARSGDSGPSGVSAFIVEKDTPGLSFGKSEEKMGWRAQPTAMVQFDDCKIPIENRVGEEGDGFKFAMKGLDGGRLNIAACALGGAQEAFDRTLEYVGERKQFNQRIGDFQTVQFKLADMETELQASRSFLRTAAESLDNKYPDAVKFCAMAKRFVTDACFNVANNALQLHGGYGYLSEFEIERIVRDLRVHQILEGTNEIMRVIIARTLVVA